MSTFSFPGLIDCHVHFREPGLTHKATMASEARAARAGGVHTVCEMPNTIPPTVTVAAFADKVRRAAEITDLDIRFFFGVTQGEHLAALIDLWSGSSEELQRLKAHCSGVKVYLDHSTGNQGVESGIIGDIFEACAKYRIPLIAHCEDPAINTEAAEQILDAVGSGPQDVALHTLMRPAMSEAKSIAVAIDLVRTHGTAFHVAHLSTREGIELVRDAKREGLPVTCEVAPHHLFLTTDDYGTLGTLGKMNPPLRTPDNQGALWAGIADGTVDCIATDHAPHTLEEKRAGEPLKAPSGVPGVETMLPLLLTVASGGWPHPTSSRPASCVLTMEDIERLCFTNPNRIFGLGKDPSEDLITIDPDQEWVITGDQLHSLCAWTPYEGWGVKGGVVGL